MALTDLFIGEKHPDRLPRVASELALSPGQLHLLLHLTRDGDGRPMRTLTTVMHCDASYVTTTVDALERRSYLERRVSTIDRRVKLVYVTSDGQRVVAQAIELLSIPPAAFECLSVAELEQLRVLLTKIAAERP
jgi:DNA-binding MarR family transcriptional regulator